MATNIFTFVNLVKGYGRLSKNKSAKKLDPNQLNKKSPKRTPHRLVSQSATKEDQFVTKIKGKRVIGPENKKFLTGQKIAKPIDDSKIELPKLPKGEKARLVFTGQNEAKFKMGNKMSDIAKQAVKKYGEGNVVLVHGGKPDKSIIDKNIIKLGEHTGLPTEADPLDYSQKNASGARKQQRNEDPNTIQLSFNTKGNLSLKDKYEDWARETYEKIGESTVGKGDVRTEGSPKYPKKTGKSISKSTSETSKFKTFLDILEDEPNQQKVASGLKHARRLSEWTEENVGHPLITDKNQHRLDFIEFGEGHPTGTKEEQTIDDFEQKTYLTTDRDNPNDAGLKKLPFKAESRGTLLAPRAGVRTVTKSFEVKGYGTAGSTYDHKAKKAIPKIKNYTVKEIKKISSGSKNPPPQKFVGGPDTYSKSSSLAQLENVELAEAKEATVARDLRSGTSQTVEADEMKNQMNKREDSQSVQRHKTSYGKSQQGELNKDITNLIDRVKQAKSIQRKNKRIFKTGSKQKFIGARSSAVQRILNTTPDVLSYDKQSATVEEIKSPKIYQKLEDTTKAGRDKQVRAEIKKGPNPFGYNTSKARAMRENRTGIVTAEARQLKSSILTPTKGFKSKQVQPQSAKPTSAITAKRIVSIGPDGKVKWGTGGRFLSPIHRKINLRSQVRTKNPQEAKPKIQPITKTKAVTTDVTSGLKKVTSTAKPSKKVVTSTAKKVSSKLQKVFHKPTGTANVEDKHKKLKFTGKGIKFTRGLGAFSLFSSILGPIRGRREAKQMLKKHGIKRDPSVMETLEHTFLPKYARPKYIKSHLGDI